MQHDFLTFIVTSSQFHSFCTTSKAPLAGRILIVSIVKLHSEKVRRQDGALLDPKINF
jgi:hypothetical protein